MENESMTLEDVAQPHEGLRPTLPLRLSLVIPAFNEARRLADGVARVNDAVAIGALMPEETEFIIVDDGSADATSSVARHLFGAFPHLKVIRLEANLGKGAAVRAGVAAASAPIIAFADADMAIDPTQTPQFMTALSEADLAIGSRSAAGASVDRPSLRRSVMNRAFNSFVNAVSGMGLSDTQCGFKAFRAPAAKLLFHCTVTDRMAFDVEILALARRLGMTIAEVPVQWLRVKGSRVRVWIEPTSMARDVVRTRRAGTSGPPVPALEITALAEDHHDGPALQSLLDQLSTTLPVLRGHGDAVVVLCPLTGEDAMAHLEARLAAIGVPAQRSSLTPAQLCAAAPLALPWAVG
jgi:dolichyl-phosphate beta-glucosyltransferase